MAQLELVRARARAAQLGLVRRELEVSNSTLAPRVAADLSLPRPTFSPRAPRKFGDVAPRVTRRLLGLKLFSTVFDFCMYGTSGLPK